MFYEITPFIGMPYTIVAFIVIVLGGLGNLLGVWSGIPVGAFGGDRGEYHFAGISPDPELRSIHARDTA